MAVYRSYSELEGKTLNYGDKLVFQHNKVILLYHVKDGFLIQPINGENDKIFHLLNLEKRIDIIKFANSAYGYKARSGLFPQCLTNDYEALTRITLALFKLCEQDQAVEVNLELI